MANITKFSRGKRDLTSSFDGGGEPPASSIPPIPSHCGHDDQCRNEATVIRVEASVKGGKRRLYSFSEVCSNKGDVMRPNEGVTFYRWRSWCARCHMNWVVGRGKSQHPAPERFTWN